ncbi:hypothetical protein C7M84_018649 [Penaeus vannamei]|uniref:Uncharacterized protein n=1 Tax=Penaeus vannamei TaxID=6689 RepID=A0A423U981_PENVA|nr:hypothetical protein C7M84_018649 [Penaeus vannamei]
MTFPTKTPTFYSSNCCCCVGGRSSEVVAPVTQSCALVRRGHSLAGWSLHRENDDMLSRRRSPLSVPGARLLITCGGPRRPILPRTRSAMAVTNQSPALADYFLRDSEGVSPAGKNLAGCIPSAVTHTPPLPLPPSSSLLLKPSSPPSASLLSSSFPLPLLPPPLLPRPLCPTVPLSPMPLSSPMPLASPIPLSSLMPLPSLIPSRHLSPSPIIPVPSHPSPPLSPVPLFPRPLSPLLFSSRPLSPSSRPLPLPSLSLSSSRPLSLPFSSPSPLSRPLSPLLSSSPLLQPRGNTALPVASRLQHVQGESRKHTVASRRVAILTVNAAAPIHRNQGGASPQRTSRARANESRERRVRHPACIWPGGRTLRTVARAGTF